MIVLVLLQLPFTAKKGEVCKVLTPTRALRAQAREYERQIVREQRAALKAADNAKKRSAQMARRTRKRRRSSWSKH